MERKLIKEKSFLFLGILFLILVLTIIFSGFWGAVSISFSKIFSSDVERTIFFLRLKRIILGVMIGGMLSVAGVILQAVLRNPLAEPYILGISSGGSLGVVLAMVFGSFLIPYEILSLPLCAFLGAIFSIFLVQCLARVNARIPPQNLLLSGVVVGVILTNILVFIVWFFEDRLIHGVIWWLLGDLEVVKDSHLFVVIVLGILGTILSFLFCRELNIISFGEEEAISLGIDLERTKKILIYTASLLSATAVSVCGIIGFVGLIVPHIVRFFVGNEHRILIPSSFLMGGIFLVISDTFARTFFSPIEIPIGVITAFIGGPMFIFLLQKEKKIIFK